MHLAGVVRRPVRVRVAFVLGVGLGFVWLATTTFLLRSSALAFALSIFVCFIECSDLIG